MASLARSRLIVSFGRLVASMSASPQTHVIRPWGVRRRPSCSTRAAKTANSPGVQCHLLIAGGHDPAFRVEVQIIDLERLHVEGVDPVAAGATDHRMSGSGTWLTVLSHDMGDSSAQPTTSPMRPDPAVGDTLLGSTRCARCRDPPTCR
jgi:hypothetical protein